MSDGGERVEKKKLLERAQVMGVRVDTVVHYMYYVFVQARSFIGFVILQLPLAL